LAEAPYTPEKVVEQRRMAAELTQVMEVVEQRGMDHKGQEEQ
jgi:hypothetical protein